MGDEDFDLVGRFYGGAGGFAARMTVKGSLRMSLEETKAPLGRGASDTL
jgi:hypothetical protein